jgi:hypothetical protein
MSTVDTNIPCPLCGETVDLVAVGNTFFDCGTQEMDFSCGNQNCRFSYFHEIKQFGGRNCWVETTHYRMDESGKVLRLTKPLKPPAVSGNHGTQCADTARIFAAKTGGAAERTSSKEKI